ncbi:MAG: hypothetical protein ACYCOU_01325 [Sulfobacillus sp.]
MILFLIGQAIQNVRHDPRATSWSVTGQSAHYEIGYLNVGHFGTGKTDLVRAGIAWPVTRRVRLVADAVESFTTVQSVDPRAAGVDIGAQFTYRHVVLRWDRLVISGLPNWDVFSVGAGF